MVLAPVDCVAHGGLTGAGIQQRQPDAVPARYQCIGGVHIAFPDGIAGQPAPQVGRQAELRLGLEASRVREPAFW